MIARQPRIAYTGRKLANGRRKRFDELGTMNIGVTWTKLNDVTIGSPRYWEIAIQNRSIWLDLAPIIDAHTKGNVLDIGAGRLAWRQALKAKAARYESADMVRTHPDLDVIADLTGDLPWASVSFETIFCCSVLEHLLDFDRALSEMHRILKPDGVLILTVPFLFYRHGDPYDYFRFTNLALIRLAERHQFELVDLKPSGGLGEIVLNPFSIVLSASLYRLGLIRVIGPINRVLTAVSRWLDRKIDKDRRYATNHIAVLRKRKGDI